MKALRVCKKCKAYTLLEKCAVCGEGTSSPHPAKYSPADKYAKYRRMAALLQTNG